MFINGLFWSGRHQKLNVYIRRHQVREMCTSSVSNVIYHKFSHGAAFYTLNGKNVNVMLEYWFTNTDIIFYIIAEWRCEIYDWILSSLTLALTLKMMPWQFYHYQVLIVRYFSRLGHFSQNSIPIQELVCRRWAKLDLTLTL